MKVKLFNDDCLNILKKGTENSIDLVVTSPPYDNLRTYNDSLEWNFDIFKSIADELKRALKVGGVIVWIVGDATIKGSETGSSFKQALYFKEIGLNLHDTMIWNKGSFSAVGALRVRYAPVFEYMFILTMGKIKTFNPIKDKKNKHAGDIRSHIMNRHKDGTTRPSKGCITKEYGQRYNIWNIPPQAQRGINVHPAPFPEKLAHDHIISWSNEGDLVLDPFMGSGTTGKMCKQLNRNFIGIEKETDYFEIAQKRIKLLRSGG